MSGKTTRPTDLPEPANDVVRGKCPACGKPRRHAFRPFCSRLCRDRDLMHWFEGRYAVPAVEVDDDEEQQDMPTGPRSFD